MAANDYLLLLRRLNEAQVPFVVVGGTAAVLHGSSTVTYDLDVLIRFSEENCDRLLRAMDGLNPRLSRTPDKRPLRLSAKELASYRNVYLATDAGRLDVLGSLPPLIDLEEILQRAVLVEVEELRIRVLSLQDLITVKAAMTRPKDRMARRSGNA